MGSGLGKSIGTDNEEQRIMAGITESVIEEAALSWFEEIGYNILHGPDIAPGELFAKRSGYSIAM